MVKTNRTFIVKEDTKELFEFVCVVDTHGIILRELFGDGKHRLVDFNEFEDDDYYEITQEMIPQYINDADYDTHMDMAKRLGVGYICPFCGGYLTWESDFMTSEVRGMEHCYVKIEDEEEIDYLSKNEVEYIKSNFMCEVDDIAKLETEFEETGYYPTMYVKCGEDYYGADDAVIGIYHCQNCGKNYEIQDCLPSEQRQYKFFQK